MMAKREYTIDVVARDWRDMNIKKLILDSRAAAGLTLQQLSDMSGVPRATISRYERGQSEPTVKNLDKLLRALNLSLTIGAAAELKRGDTDD